MSQDPRSTSEISSRLVRAAAERAAPGLRAAGKARKIAEILPQIPTFSHAWRASLKLEVLIEFRVARELPAERGAWETRCDPSRAMPIAGSSLAAAFWSSV